MIDFDKVVGLKVITSGAHILGEVKGAKIETETWAIKYLNVKLSGDAAESLGMKKRFGSSSICVPVSMVLAVAHVVTINKSMQELEKSQDITECKD